jgi:hypothetical protein
LQGTNYLVVHNDVIVRVLIPKKLALPDNPNVWHPFHCDPLHLTAPLVPVVHASSRGMGIGPCESPGERRHRPGERRHLWNRVRTFGGYAHFMTEIPLGWITQQGTGLVEGNIDRVQII